MGRDQSIAFKVLETLAHETTGTGEREAALHALRRLGGKNGGFASLFGNGGTTERLQFRSYNALTNADKRATELGEEIKILKAGLKRAE